MSDHGKASRGVSPYIWAIPATFLLLAYALLNGVPFLYPDALVYFAYGETFWQKVGAVLAGLWSTGISADGIPPEAAPAVGDVSTESPPPAPSSSDDGWNPEAGRSIYYSILAALPGIFQAPWNGVAIQAYCGALTIAFAWRTVIGTVGFGYLAIMAVLGFGSTLGMFASTAMPDIWAAIGILAIATIIAGRGRAGRADDIVLWGIVLFSAVAHSSHLAVLAAFVVLGALVRAAGFAAVSWGIVGKLAAVVVLAAGLSAGGNMVVERAAGNPPMGMPFLTAHLVDGGPGMDFIRNACPAAEFAICERADRLPVEWRDFIFGIAVPDDYRRELAEDDVSFALATLRHDPAGVIALALRDTAWQFVMIGLVTTPIRAEIGERAAVESIQTPLALKVRAGTLYDEGWLYRSVSTLNKILVLAGLAGLAVVTTRQDAGQAWGRLLAVSITGLLLNAAVCGILASPYDRFQARVAWLIPLVTIIALAGHLQRRQAPLKQKSRTS